MNKRQLDEIAKNKFSPLLYRSERGWKHMPYWVRFFRGLGASAAELPDPGRRMIFSVATPTRSLAAAFVALGVIESRSTVQAKSSLGHFENLCSLPKGAPLFLRDGKVIMRVFSEGTVHRSGQRFLKLLKAGRRKGREPGYQLVPENRAHLIERSEDDQTRPTHFAAGREISSQHEFLSNYLGAAETLRFLMASRLDCAIVGTQSMLMRELCEYEIGSTSDSGVLTGRLNDLLLVKRLSRTMGVFRSEIFRPAPSMKLPENSEDAVVVFDGANGYLNCRHNFNSRVWIVLLDKTEPQFELAAQTVNQEFARAERPVEFKQGKDPIPAGVEIVAFEVAK